VESGFFFPSFFFGLAWPGALEGNSFRNASPALGEYVEKKKTILAGFSLLESFFEGWGGVLLLLFLGSRTSFFSPGNGS
jgi:hypothetical protein